MAVRSRMRRASKGAFDLAMEGYKMEGPTNKIDSPLGNLPSLKDFDDVKKKK